MKFFTTRLVFSLIFCAHIAHAATIHSAQTGNWNTLATWETTIPTSADDVIIDAPDVITIDNIMGGNACKSLTVNGKLIYNSETNFSVGDFNDRTAACLVNGILEYSVGYSFKIYGYLKFTMGSTFQMTSGGMTIDGTLGATTSVSAGQAHLDVTDIGTLNCSGGTIALRNPHFDAATPCLKGAKNFGNTIAFGTGNTPDVTNDYTVSETHKPIFGSLEINFSSSQSRFKATDITINNAVGVLNGTFYNYSTATPIKVKGDFNVNQGVTLTGNFEFNGTSQQNINPQFGSGATLVTFNGDVIVNNPTEVKSKINMTIVGGDLKFTQGRFDTEAKTLTLERTPVGTNSSKYIITYNFYLDIGTVLIQNLSGNTLFPIGTANTYAPVWVNATSGNFKASVTPLQTAAPSGLGYSTVNLEWNVQRVFGPPTADLTVQWNTSDETSPFTALRSHCSLFHYNAFLTTWEAVTFTGGATTSGTVHTKTATGVDSFSPFTLFTSSTLPVEMSQFTGKKQGNRAQLSWTTATEKDNLGFEIQRNTEGSDFKAIGFVKSQGNANSPTDYVFWDNNFTKTAYYRLKQTDINGNETFSKIITLENTAKNAVVSVFPNPILRGSPLNIQLSDTAVSDDWMIEIYNANGKRVGQQRGVAPIQTDDWLTGIYLVKIVNNVNVSVFKVVKQ